VGAKWKRKVWIKAVARLGANQKHIDKSQQQIKQQSAIVAGLNEYGRDSTKARQTAHAIRGDAGILPSLTATISERTSRKRMTSNGAAHFAAECPDRGRILILNVAATYVPIGCLTANPCALS